MVGEVGVGRGPVVRRVVARHVLGVVAGPVVVLLVVVHVHGWGRGSAGRGGMLGKPVVAVVALLVGVGVGVGMGVGALMGVRRPGRAGGRVGPPRDLLVVPARGGRALIQPVVVLHHAQLVFQPGVGLQQQVVAGLGVVILLGQAVHLRLQRLHAAGQLLDLALLLGTRLSRLAAAELALVQLDGCQRVAGIASWRPRGGASFLLAGAAAPAAGRRLGALAE